MLFSFPLSSRFHVSDGAKHQRNTSNAPGLKKQHCYYRMTGNCLRPKLPVVVVSAVYHSSAATLNNISISLSVNFVHRNKHLKRHGKSDSNFSDLHHEETRHQAHRKSPGKVPANHPMECRFRGLGEGIKNRVQQYHRTRDFGNTPE